MTYKDILYKNYYRTHSQILHGETTLAKVESEFKVIDFYLGKFLPKRIDSSILDVGCGNGNLVHYLIKKGYSNVVGIDLSEEQINVGRGLGIEGLLVSDILTYLKSKAGFFDCIVARDVIEHLTKQESFDALCLISSSLNSNGKFIMQVPNGQGLFYTSVFYGDFTHEMPYTHKTVVQLLLNAGFSQVECYPINPYPGSWRGKIRSVLWRFKVMQIRFWKMIESGNPSGIFSSNIIAIGTK